MPTAPDAELTIHRSRCQTLWGGERPVLGANAFQREDEYKWRGLRADHQKPVRSWAFSTDMAAFLKVLPPDAVDFMDSEACEDFNEYVRATNYDRFFITLPPALRGMHVCKDPEGSTTRKLTHRPPTQCSRVLEPLDQVRMIRSGGLQYTLGCAAHGNFQAYERERKAYKADFDAFRAWKHDGNKTEPFKSTLPESFTARNQVSMSPLWPTSGQWALPDGPCGPGTSSNLNTVPRQETQLVLGQSMGLINSPSLSIASLDAPLAQPSQQSGPRTHEALCQALFRTASPLPRSGSFLFEQKYSWRDCGPAPPCDRFQIGDLQAEKLLPPDPTDYPNPKTCEKFNRYVRQTRPELLYPLVPPKTSLRCAHGQEIMLPGTGRLVWRQCPTLLQGWSHAELRSNGEGTNSYSAYCLEHRRQEDHATSRKRQREDFDLFRETESFFASTSLGEKSSTKRSPTASADERVAGNQIGLDTASSGSGLFHERWRPLDSSRFPAPLFASIPIALADQRPMDMSRLPLIQRDLRPEGLSRTAMPTDHTEASEPATRNSNAQIWFDDWLNLDEHPREEELDELERRLFDEPVSGEGIGDLKTQHDDSLVAPHDDIPE